jgi:hypothetical protein
MPSATNLQYGNTVYIYDGWSGFFGTTYTITAPITYILVQESGMTINLPPVGDYQSTEVVLKSISGVSAAPSFTVTVDDAVNELYEGSTGGSKTISSGSIERIFAFDPQIGTSGYEPAWWVIH